MEWSTVAVIGIATFAVLVVLYLAFALYMAKLARRQMEKMHEDFEERKRNPFGDRGRR